jgi:hypothetical protein
VIPATYPPPAPPLASCFTVPTREQVDQNQEYWDAYKVAQHTAAQNCPSATDIPDWGTYHALVIASVPPVSPLDTSGVGANQAVFDASNWEWTNNPNSGHNKVLS